MLEDPQASVDLTGLIDLHIHSAPDIRPRKLNDVEVARAARAAGLKAVLIKSHVTITADRASIAEKVVPGVRVFGAVVLNYEVGGLNLTAVETALKLGAREVFLPTFSARGSGRRPEGIVVIDDAGDLLPVVLDILKLVAERDVILGTGHLSVPEIILVVKAARRLGVTKVLITHPEGRLIAMPADVQRELASDGACFERCYESALADPDLGVAGLARRIRQVGPASTVISTDLGQAENPSPVDGFRSYIIGLMAEGITWREIRVMAEENPTRLLGL